MDETVVVSAYQHALENAEDAAAGPDGLVNLVLEAGHVPQRRFAAGLGRQVFDRRGVLVDVGEAVELHHYPVMANRARAVELG